MNAQVTPAAVLLLQSAPCRPVLRLLVETLAPWADASASVSLGPEWLPVYSQPGDRREPPDRLLGITRADIHRLARAHEALKLILDASEKGGAHAAQAET